MGGGLAARHGGKRSTTFWTQEARPMHFTYLVNGTEQMFTGKPAWPPSVP